MASINKNLRKLLLLLLVILFIISAWIGSEWISFLRTPLIPTYELPSTFILKHGTPLRELANQLKNKGILKKPILFIVLVKIHGADRHLHAGEYLLTPGIRPKQLLKKFVIGQVVLHSFIIVPGRTFHETLTELENNPYIDATLKNLSDQEIMQRLGLTDKHPEGLFFPETYKFALNTKDIDILKEAYKFMQNELTTGWHGRDPTVPYTSAYQALISASIVEKESASTTERPIIAGIIINRLQKHMYLQMDPTVIYGLGENFNGKLTKEDLQQKTPYNTYVYKGLPPTPICMPSKNAIYATLHPQPVDYLYFVAKGDGTHVFSTTLKEQNAAVQKYQINKH